MRRLLAVALAVAMVAGALYVRDRIDDDGDEGGSGGGGDAEVGLVVCATELAAACTLLERRGVEVRVEPAGTTADALVAGELELDGWLTLEPWPEMVNGARQRAAQPPVLAEDDAPPLARTPIVLVWVAEGAAALERECGSPAYWACIGEHAGRPWADVAGAERLGGEVRVGHDPADTSATGLLVLGSAVTDFFGMPPTSSTDFQQDEFRTWFTRLERSVPQFGTRFGSLIEHLILQRSTFNAVGALEAPALVGGARREGLTILYPSPMATADAVLVWAPGEETDRFDDTVRDVLRGAGWRAADDADLPAANGLPPAGVLEALRRLWRDVAR